MSDCNFIFSGPGGVAPQEYCKEHARWEVECLRAKVADVEKREQRAVQAERERVRELLSDGRIKHTTDRDGSWTAVKDDALTQISSPKE